MILFYSLSTRAVTVPESNKYMMRVFSFKRYSGYRLGVRSILIISLAILTCLSGYSAAADKHSLPFSPLEKITFRVKWAFITAGEANLELLPMESVNGIKSFHIVFTARTSEFVDLFYKVRDRIDSYTNADMTRSMLYRKQHKGRSKKDVIVTFDWERKLAQYSNFGEEMAPVPILPGTFDPLSVFYAFRLYDLKENAEVNLPVTDGKKCIMGKAKVIRRERIHVQGNSYDTYLVEPDLEHIGGVFRKSRNAKLQIWVTADDKRLPVRIKSKVTVGSFVAELISFVEGTPDAPPE